MAIENKPGGMESIRQQLAAHADALRAGAASALRQKAAEIREAIGPEQLEADIVPKRPFGRDDGGQDIKQIVWTGHAVETSEGERYFGAAGLTETGYFRAAEVRVYGSDEYWRWQAERYFDRADAVASAERIAESRLEREEPRTDAAPWREFYEKEQADMALPEHVKALADQARLESSMEKMEVRNLETGTPINDRADPYDSRAMEAQRDQQRQNALDRKGPEPTPEPDR